MPKAAYLIIDFWNVIAGINITPICCFVSHLMAIAACHKDNGWWRKYIKLWWVFFQMLLNTKRRCETALEMGTFKGCNKLRKIIRWQKNNGHRDGLRKLAMKLCQIKHMPNTSKVKWIIRLKKTGKALGKHVRSLFSIRFSQVVKTRM